MRRASLPPGDGSAVGVDCRLVERRRPRDVAQFDAAARACALVGWEYRLLGRGCAGDRKPTVVGRLPASPAPSAWTVDVLRRVFAIPTPVMAAAEASGDPIAVLPVLVSSPVVSRLTSDLSRPLHQATLVGGAGGSAVTLTGAAVLRPGDWVSRPAHGNCLVMQGTLRP